MHDRQVPVIPSEPSPAASTDRRPRVAPPTAWAVRVAAVEAVGARFLRTRPWIVAPVAVANVGLVAASGAPATQRLALGGAIAAALVLFVVEAAWCRRRPVGARWLAGSLAATALALGAGCALSGGLTSPLLSLVLAPVVVAFAAFGRTRPATAMLALAAVVVAALAALPVGAPFPPLGWPAVPWMYATSFVATVALAHAGVAALVEAHAAAAAVLDRMRLATLAEAAARGRSAHEVGARVAHEIKNPLAAVRALVQLSADDAAPRVRKRVDVVLGELDRIDALVRDYLTLARPLTELAIEPVALDELADDVVGLVAAQAATAGLRLVRAGAPITVDADPRRLREALLNLVSNALAATPRGGVVTVHARPERGGGALVVEDTGPGLPPGAGEAAFVTTRAGGTGLGLVLARATVEQHGGRLALAGRDGGGTVATMWLPAAPGRTS